MRVFYTTCRGYWEETSSTRTAKAPSVFTVAVARLQWKRRERLRREPRDSRATDGKTSGQPTVAEWSYPPAHPPVRISAPTQGAPHSARVPRNVKDAVRKIIRASVLVKKREREERVTKKKPTWEWVPPMLDGKVLVGSEKLWREMIHVAEKRGGWVLAVSGPKGRVVPHIVRPPPPQDGVTISGYCPHGRQCDALVKASAERFRKTAVDVRRADLDLERRSAACGACKALGLRTGEKWERLKNGRMKGT